MCTSLQQYSRIVQVHAIIQEASHKYITQHMVNIQSASLFLWLATMTLPFCEFDDITWLNNLRFLVPQREDYTAWSVRYPALPNHTTISGQVTRSCVKRGTCTHVTRSRDGIFFMHNEKAWAWESEAGSHNRIWSRTWLLHVTTYNICNVLRLNKPASCISYCRSNVRLSFYIGTHKKALNEPIHVSQFALTPINHDENTNNIF